MTRHGVGRFLIGFLSSGAADRPYATATSLSATGAKSVEHCHWCVLADFHIAIRDIVDIKKAQYITGNRGHLPDQTQSATPRTQVTRRRG